MTAQQGPAGSPPKVLLVDDDVAALEEQIELVESLGYEGAVAGSAGEALARFSADQTIGIVITDWAMPGGTGLDLARQLAEQHAETRPFVVILLTGTPSMDLAIEAMQKGLADFLRKPASREDYRAALDRAAKRLAELSARTPAVIASVRTIQESIQALSQKLGLESELAAAPLVKAPVLSAEALRAIVKARQQRAEFFGGDLFGEPAWDLLLELMLARLDNRTESVTSLALAASLPTSTAVRWLREMAGHGLLTQTTDPKDARRTLVWLTDGAADRLLAYFARVAKTPIV